MGDGQTSAANVTIVGSAEAGAAVTLGASGPAKTASTAGVFQFTNVALALGVNNLAIHVEDLAGNATDIALMLTRVAGGAAGDMVLTWDQNTLLAIQADGSDPLSASRTLAMESVAVFDAVNAIEGVNGNYVSVAAPAGASMDAAVAAAAARVLIAAYPTQAATLEPGVTFVSATAPTDRNGRELAWSAGTIEGCPLLAWRSARR